MTTLKLVVYEQVRKRFLPSAARNFLTIIVAAFIFLAPAVNDREKKKDEFK